MRLLLVLLTAADYTTTRIGLALGGSEANPVVAAPIRRFGAGRTLLTLGVARVILAAVAPAETLPMLVALWILPVLWNPWRIWHNSKLQGSAADTLIAENPTEPLR